MSMITNRKLIAISIIAIMIITLATPVFAKATVSTSKWAKAKTSFDVKEGKTIKIYIKSNTYKGNIYWSSSNSKVAEILGGTNSYCQIKGVTGGKSATITIREGSSSGKVAAQFTINVKSNSSTSVDNSNKYEGITVLLNLTIKGLDIALQFADAVVTKLIEKANTPDPTPTPTPEPEPVVSGTSVYLTNYKPSDDNWGNLQTAKLGGVLKKDSNGNVGIVHPNVYTNSKGWYVYRKDGVDYVILARLKNNAGSYGGFDEYEIVDFNYNGTTYKGVILDSGGERRNLPTLDIFRLEKGCTDAPGLVQATAVATGKKLSVISNHNYAKYNTILRYK